MAGIAGVPLLFLDVDGPLIPFGAAHAYPTYESGRPNPGNDGHPLLERIDPAHGERLLALGCELVWATTWMQDANDGIGPRLGLPRLEVVAWPEPSALDQQDAWEGVHWKTRTLIERAEGRPFIWIDDEITDADRLRVAADHQGHALLHRVDARLGLTDTDYALLNGWLHRLGKSVGDVVRSDGPRLRRRRPPHRR